MGTALGECGGKPRAAAAFVKAIVIFLVSLFLLAAVVFVTCDPVTGDYILVFDISGTVRDSTGAPIEGAKVIAGAEGRFAQISTTPDNGETMSTYTYTDKSGQFSIHSSHNFSIFVLGALWGKSPWYHKHLIGSKSAEIAVIRDSILVARKEVPFAGKVRDDDSVYVSGLDIRIAGDAVGATRESE
jgi:hypothetical protein